MRGVLVCVLCCAALAGCVPPRAGVGKPPAAVAGSGGSSRLDLAPSRDAMAAYIVDFLRKPVMGRRASLADVARVVRDDAPIISDAAAQPAVQPDLATMARDEGLSLPAARDRWCALQEADILIESGGDTEEESYAHAVGVAQWIAETARRAGLRIDEVRSRALTAQIEPLKWRAAWCAYWAAPGADPNARGAPPDCASPAAAAQQAPVIAARLAELRAERARIDPRYDPRQALFAHTRYLLGLYPRFPSPDWIFQAFHGGEAGVERLLRRYLGSAWPGSTARAIRFGAHGRPLTYEQVYFAVSPRDHAAAFSYLFGRGDDHRHYWWKLRAALGAIALFRRDPAAFRAAWAALLPGRAHEAIWYPCGLAAALQDPRAVQGAERAGRLLPVRAIGGVDAAPGATLQPSALGLLRLVAAVLRRADGKAVVKLGDTVVPETALKAARARRRVPAQRYPTPPDPQGVELPGGGPPADFDYHSTGLAFDLEPPADREQRKVLEYALGWLQDRQALWQRSEAARDGMGPSCYHVVPNPRFAAQLTAFGRGGPLPQI